MTKNSLLTHRLLALMFMLAMRGSALAQEPGGSIRGTVVDPSGALVPRAQVTILTANGVTRTIKTSPTGKFEMSNLAPGTYSVSIDAVGFTPALEGGIQVLSNKVTRDEIKLGISVNQEIDVQGSEDGSANVNSETRAVPASRL